MTPEVQTILSLLAVGIAAIWLVRRVFRKKSTGCGGGECGAISPDVKKLQAKIKN